MYFQISVLEVEIKCSFLLNNEPFKGCLVVNQYKIIPDLYLIKRCSAFNERVLF